MPLIPSWAPNLHPLLIHFPIVLLIVAVAADLADVALNRASWLRPAATALYVAGALALVAAYLTGLRAGATVLVPGMAYPVITAHRQWALATMTMGIVVAGLRLVLMRGVGARPSWRIALLTMGVVSAVLIQQTAERGARLVYEFGTGVIGR